MNNFIIKLFVLIVSILSAISLFNDAPNLALAFLVLHLFVAWLLLTFLFSIVERKNIKFFESPLYIFVLIHILYFSGTSVVYLDQNPMDPSLFDGYFHKFFSQMVIGAAIFSMILLLNFKATNLNYITSICVKQMSWPFFFSLYFVLCIIEVYLYMNGYRYLYGEDMVYNILDYKNQFDLALLLVRFGLYSCLIISFGILLFRKKFTFLRFLFFLCLPVSIFLNYAIYYKVRSAAFIAIIVAFVVIQTFKPKIGNILLYVFSLLTTVFSPWIVAASTLLSGRADYFALDNFIAQTSFRMNLGEYAYILAQKNVIDLNYKIIWDSFLNAIPSALFPAKHQYLFGALGDVNIAAGLDPTLDYPDTLFSTGVMMFGWIGYFLVPIGFLYLMNKLFSLGNALSRNSAWLAFLIFVFCISLTNIELGPSELFLHLRNALMSILILFPLWAIFRRKHVL